MLTQSTRWSSRRLSRAIPGRDRFRRVGCHFSFAHGRGLRMEFLKKKQKQKFGGLWGQLLPQMCLKGGNLIKEALSSKDDYLIRLLRWGRERRRRCCCYPAHVGTVQDNSLDGFSQVSTH